MEKSERGYPSPSAAQWPQMPAGEQLYSALVGSISDCALFLMDMEGFIRSWNAGAAAIYGYTAAEIVGRNISVLYLPEEVERGYPRRTLEASARNGRSEDEGWRMRKNGERFWARVVVHALRDEAGTLYGFGKIARDLTVERHRNEALLRSEERTLTLRDQALRDPLTGAFNRRHLREFLNGAVERGTWMAASLLAVDIDSFKNVNDRHGHDAGDEVLVIVARVASVLLRSDDRLFRIGGDEFLIYLSGAGLEEARRVGERLRLAVETTRTPSGVSVTTSIGAAQLTSQDTVESWIQRADAAMYEAKRAGRNRVS